MAAILLSRNSLGYSEYSIESEEDLKTINIANVAPTSSATLVNDQGMHVYMLRSDKSKWQKI